MRIVTVNPYKGHKDRARYELRSLDECWPWLGSKDPDGYGQVFNRRLGRLDKAHRVVYEQQMGRTLPPRSSGLELDHTCRNRACVNPAHMELVTVQENRRRRDAARRNGRQS